MALIPLRLRALWQRFSLLDRVAMVVLVFYAVCELFLLVGFAIPGKTGLNYLSLLTAIYVVARLLPWLRRELLWSLRNRLIVAYVFIAVVPIVLLLGMVGLSTYLLYLQFGAHLIEDDLNERVAVVSDIGNSILGALEREDSASPRASSANLLSRPAVASLLSVGRSHVPGLEAQIEPAGGRRQAMIDGVFESDDRLFLRAIVTGPTVAGEKTVTVSAPVSPEMLDEFSPVLGPIQLTTMRLASRGQNSGLVLVLEDRRFVPLLRIASEKRRLHPPTGWLDVRINGSSIVEAFLQDPQSGQMITAPVLVFFSVRPSEINHRLFTSLGALGDPLVVALTVIGVAFLLLEVAALATGVVLTRTITSTIAGLYDATQHVRRGNFAHRVRVQRRDQLGVLGESFNSMTSSISSLIEEQKQKQRLENEVSIAREVQAQLFPQKLPSIPGMEMAAVCRAARMVSGDYYDLLALGPSRAGIVLADISGKGISAALLMASLQAALRSQAQQDGNIGTAELTSRLNRHLFLNTSDERYATFFFALFDAESRRLTYTNAGHLPPLYIRGGVVDHLGEGGTVIGLFPEVEYAQADFSVEPGSMFVAFSDGLVEPENVYGEQFGTERLTGEILRHRDLPVSVIAERVLAAVEDWAGTSEQADDMTIVVVRWK